MSPELMPPLQEKSPCCRVAAADTSRCIVVISVRDAFGACPGEIFTSPTPDKIFECAMQIDGGEGVLLIIKNYTGDILNFETATELLHDSGVKVTTVVIDDDVAVKDSLYTAGRRGVANTVLIENS